MLASNPSNHQLEIGILIIKTNNIQAEGGPRSCPNQQLKL